MTCPLYVLKNKFVFLREQLGPCNVSTTKPRALGNPSCHTPRIADYSAKPSYVIAGPLQPGEVFAIKAFLVIESFFDITGTGAFMFYAITCPSF